MYKHLAKLGIDHKDFRHPNIVMAPHTPDSWPGLVSPWSKKPYRYRIIDFARSRKTNWALIFFSAWHEDWITRLLECIDMGYAVETWEI